jgi:hypothetical protein
MSPAGSMVVLQGAFPPTLQELVAETQVLVAVSLNDVNPSEPLRGSLAADQPFEKSGGGEDK